MLNFEEKRQRGRENDGSAEGTGLHTEATG